MERRKFIASTVAFAAVDCDLIGSRLKDPSGFWSLESWSFGGVEVKTANGIT